MTGIERRIESWLWKERHGRSRLQRTAIVAGRYAWALVEDLLDGDLSLRATSLVYTTMLATAPLLAFGFSIVKGLGLHRRLTPVLRELLAPLGARSGEIADRVIGFVDNVSAELASLSLVVFIAAAIVMAQQVESSINFAWNVDRPRSFARRLSEYVTVLLIGPTVMSIALGLIAALADTALVQRLRLVQPLGEWLAWLGAAVPYLLVIGAFTLLYEFVPNTRVEVRRAAVAGFAAGLAWAAAGSLFTTLVVNASRYDAIYSGFAIVLITMLWLHLSWLIVLLGAKLAFYLQNPEHMRRATRPATLPSGLRERLALAVMLLAGRALTERRPGVGLEPLASQLMVPRRVLEPVVAALRQQRLLVETADRRLMPGADLHGIRLAEIIEAVRGPGHDHAGIDRACGPAVRALADRIEAAVLETAGDGSLADLIELDAATPRPALPHAADAQPRSGGAASSPDLLRH